MTSKNAVKKSRLSATIPSKQTNNLILLTPYINISKHGSLFKINDDAIGLEYIFWADVHLTKMIKVAIKLNQMKSIMKMLK
jgi:hypothetical protein